MAAPSNPDIGDEICPLRAMDAMAFARPASLFPMSACWISAGVREAIAMGLPKTARINKPKRENIFKGELLNDLVT